MPICKACTNPFEITALDKSFYVKFDVPEPTLCPDCRFQRRAAHRNENNLYKRSCDFSKKPIISIFHKDCPFPVYSQEVWWADGWNPSTYSQEYDFNIPFFSQFKTLRDKVPRLCTLSKQSENSEYTNHAANNKNCYMSVITFRSEHVYYSRKIFDATKVYDCDYIFKSGELLYDCFWCDTLYNCTSCVYCSNSNNLKFCIDCKGCEDCYMSCNLRNKKYYYYNEQLTKEEYELKSKEANLMNFETLKLNAIYPALHNENSENVTGDFLTNCNNVNNCYYSFKGENCNYCIEFDSSRDEKVSLDCMDSFGFGGCELIYEVQAQSNGYNNKFCSWSYDVSNCEYCDMCFNSKNLFGCVGIHNDEYCIFNKKYKEEEYKSLKALIIEHMKQTKEYGEFFPAEISIFGYNETLANDFFPLTKDQAIEKGYHWRDPELQIENAHDREIPDVQTCNRCSKKFRILKTENDFYTQMEISTPTQCPNCRRAKRLQYRNPFMLSSSQCASCKKEIQTSYINAALKIYCEDCYQGSII